MLDLNEVANGVTAVLNQRASEAQAAQRELESQRESESQRQIAEVAENARVQRQMALRELTLLENKEREVKQSLEAKSQEHSSLGKEVQALFGQHNFLLMQLHQMKKQLGL